MLVPLAGAAETLPVKVKAVKLETATIIKQNKNHQYSFCMPHHIIVFITLVLNC